MNEYHDPIIVEILENCKPDHRERVGPSAYIAYFRSIDPESQKQAERLIKDIQKLILTDGKFEDFRVGINEGMVIAELDWRGRITFPPCGEAVNKASNNAKGKQDLAQQ